MTPAKTAVFDLIYGRDLVYVPDCWKLCGDAHCCSFARYKQQFRFIGRVPGKQIFILPGEQEYLAARGRLTQFGKFDHKRTNYSLGEDTIAIESIVSQRVGCMCEHATRLTLCRLYPLMPIFDLEGKLIGIDRNMGIYEELESIDALDRACKVDAVPFSEMQNFLAICSAIATVPEFLFYFAAYRLVKLHCRDRIAAQTASPQKNSFQTFEELLVGKKLIDHAQLDGQLATLLAQFRGRYGAGFTFEPSAVDSHELGTPVA